MKRKQRTWLGLPGALLLVISKEIFSFVPVREKVVFDCLYFFMVMVMSLNKYTYHCNAEQQQLSFLLTIKRYLPLVVSQLLKGSI